MLELQLLQRSPVSHNLQPLGWCRVVPPPPQTSTLVPLTLSVERGSHARALFWGSRFPLPPGSPVPSLPSALASIPPRRGHEGAWADALQGPHTLGIGFLDLAVPCLPAASEGAGSGREQI